MAVAGSIASRHKGGARSSKQAFHYILHYSSSPENKGKWLAIKRWQRDTFPPHTQHTVWPIKFSRNLSWLELDCWCAKMKTKTSTTNCFILERVRQRKKKFVQKRRHFADGTSQTVPPLGTTWISPTPWICPRRLPEESSHTIIKKGYLNKTNVTILDLLCGLGQIYGKTQSALLILLYSKLC